MNAVKKLLPCLIALLAACSDAPEQLTAPLVKDGPLTAAAMAKGNGVAYSVAQVTVSGLPEAHGGAEFAFTLTYNADHPTSYQTVQDSVGVANGSVEGVKRAHTTQADRNKVWSVTIDPDNEQADVTITVRGVSATVLAAAATLSGLPEQHGGEQFTVTVTFHGRPEANWQTVQNSVIGVEGGSVESVRRAHDADEDRNYVWEATVEPDAGTGDVTVTARNASATVPYVTGNTVDTTKVKQPRTSKGSGNPPAAPTDAWIYFGGDETEVRWIAAPGISIAAGAWQFSSFRDTTSWYALNASVTVRPRDGSRIEYAVAHEAIEQDVTSDFFHVTQYSFPGNWPSNTSRDLKNLYRHENLTWLNKIMGYVRQDSTGARAPIYATMKRWSVRSITSDVAELPLSGGKVRFTVHMDHGRVYESVTGSNACRDVNSGWNVPFQVIRKSILNGTTVVRDTEGDTLTQTQAVTGGDYAYRMPVGNDCTFSVDVTVGKSVRDDPWVRLYVPKPPHIGHTVPLKADEDSTSTNTNDVTNPAGPPTATRDLPETVVLNSADPFTYTISGTKATEFTRLREQLPIWYRVTSVAGVDADDRQEWDDDRVQYWEFDPDEDADGDYTVTVTVSTDLTAFSYFSNWERRAEWVYGYTSSGSNRATFLGNVFNTPPGGGLGKAVQKSNTRGDGRVTQTRADVPEVSLAGDTVTKAANVTLDFVVTLSRASTGTVTMEYETKDGSAKAGEDYTAASGTLTFAAGETSKTVSVAVLDDGVNGEHSTKREVLTFRLSNPTGAFIVPGNGTSSASGYIKDP